MATPNTDARIITTLPRAAWRDLRFPWYTAAPVHVKHRLPERKYPYIDVAGHDWTGTDWPAMAFKIHFTNTIRPAAHGLGVRLFPDYWQKFLFQILDGAPGDLDHPLIGPVRARVESWNTEAASDNLGGVLLNISFVRTNETPGIIAALNVGDGGDPTRLAELASVYVQPYGLTMLRGRSEAMVRALYGLPKNPHTIADVWDGLMPQRGVGMGFLTQLWAFIADLDSIIDDLLGFDDVATWQALAACRAFRRYLNTAALSLANANRPTGARVISEPTTLDAWARETGMTLPEAMALNLSTLKRPRIERGTRLRFYITRGKV